MKQFSLYILLICGFFLLRHIPMQAQHFTLEAVRSYPFPSGLTAAAQGSRIAWVFDEQGRRNVYVAEGPTFKPRKLTNYTEDDGQEITSMSLSADGQWVVYVRGGEHGAIWDETETVNPTSEPVPPLVQIWQVPFAGGEPKALAEGDAPVISPKSDKVAFTRVGQVWEARLDGESEAKPIVRAQGTATSLEWSPDGAQLAFVSERGEHSFVGIYTDSKTPIKWMAPSFHMDQSPRWAPDGKRLVFVRTPGTGGAPETYLDRHHKPWSIWVADAATGTATQLWKAPQTLEGSEPSTHGGFNLHWGANDRIVFMSHQDGWPHLYSIAAAGGTPLLLTKGGYMAEHIRLSPDRKWLLFSANTGPDKTDIDRRHVARVPVDKPAVELLTKGEGLEWLPVVTGDGATVALISATAQRPPLPAVMPFKGGKPEVLARELLPKNFPQEKLVTPKQVIYKAPDGVTVHAQLFEPKGGPARKPAIIYVHGGPSRQMLLGWHYSDYYANAYATNQYLASLGFVVMAVNYRMGIGYGHAFHHPEKAGVRGASEYQDIRAAATWLAEQPQVDPKRIGIYGGSYGGYLTALALGRDSDLFAAGVDIHGMSDRTSGRISELVAPDRYERAPDADKAAKVIWESSPASSVGTWKSPVLIIHGDDDRNVSFSNSVDLVRRLEAQGVPYETLVLVDDTHHWLTFRNVLKVGEATTDFFKRKLLKPQQTDKR